VTGNPTDSLIKASELKRIYYPVPFITRTNNDLQNIHIKTKDRVARTPLKTGSELMSSGRVSSFLNATHFLARKRSLGIRYVKNDSCFRDHHYLTIKLVL
jgi:hypothetical protein